MKDDSTSGAAGALMAVALILLLLVGGAGFYLVVGRQQMAAGRARQAEAIARAEAESARADAIVARLAAEGQESLTDQGAASAAVESVLRAQQEAWNRGDIDAFVQHYWKSDEVTFSGGGKTTRGWEATAQRYRERYPTREKMGRLTFDNLEITPLGEEAALVLGEWGLERGTGSGTLRAPDAEKVGASTHPTESEPVSGSFSLVFRKIEGRWVIVHDHTSRLVE